MTERKDVNVYAVPAVMGVRAPEPFSAPRKVSLMDVVKDAVLFDPERPTMGPNELWQEIKDNPQSLMVGCHSCKKEMPVAVYLAHLWDTKEGIGCISRYYNTMDITNRRFAGASIGDTDE